MQEFTISPETITQSAKTVGGMKVRAPDIKRLIDSLLPQAKAQIVAAIHKIPLKDSTLRIRQSKGNFDTQRGGSFLQDLKFLRIGEQMVLDAEEESPGQFARVMADHQWAFDMTSNPVKAIIADWMQSLVKVGK